MNKVITINLNGRAYQLEEKGYELLRDYLEKAETKLHDNPDKSEVMADFEQAIADKCDEYLRGHKNVVSTEQVEAIIAKMGSVENGATAEGGAPSRDKAASAGATPKRLYRIPQGEWIVGVCTGLAAYFTIDVTLMRVLFVILTLLTHGLGVILYIVLLVVIPVARTDEERAWAHGTAPFNAHDFIEQAKTRYAEFQKNHPDMPPVPENPHDKNAWRAWKQEMKAKKHAWKDERRKERFERHADWHDEWHGNHVGAIIGGIITAALWIAFIYVVWSFLAYGTIFGHMVGAGHPLWVTLLFLSLIFWIILLPFRAIMRHSHHGHGHCHHHDGGLWGLLVLILLFYVASLLFPPVHTAWEHVLAYLQTVR